ncbi:MAG: hypothetical protein VKJ04_02565 [Vampirovibrionales bacterium]|nr:hypothetical protein [Vampirovibrionales bacterium]
MLSNQTLWQEFAGESLEHLSSLQKRILSEHSETLSPLKDNSFAQTPVKPNLLERHALLVHKQPLLRFLQSVKTGAEFYGFRDLMKWSVFLKRFILLWESTEEGQDAPCPDSIQGRGDILMSALSQIAQQLLDIQEQRISRVSIQEREEEALALFEPTHPSAFSFAEAYRQMSVLEKQLLEEEGCDFYELLVYADDDLVEQGRDSLEFLQQMEGVCDILNIRLDLEHFPGLGQCLQSQLPIRFRVASSLSVEALASRLSLSERAITYG